MEGIPKETTSASQQAISTSLSPRERKRGWLHGSDDPSLALKDDAT